MARVVERRRDSPEYDPAEESLIRKVARVELTNNPLLDALLRVAVIVGMSGGTAVFSSEVKNVEVEVLRTQLGEARAQVLKLETEQDSRWKSYYARRREAQGEHLCYERRFTRLETRAGIEAPTCSAHAEAESSPASSER